MCGRRIVFALSIVLAIAPSITRGVLVEDNQSLTAFANRLMQFRLDELGFRVSSRDVWKPAFYAIKINRTEPVSGGVSGICTNFSNALWLD